MIGVFPSSLRAAAFRAHSGAVWQSSGRIRFLSIFWCATQQILPISCFVSDRVSLYNLGWLLIHRSSCLCLLSARIMPNSYFFKAYFNYVYTCVSVYGLACVYDRRVQKRALDLLDLQLQAVVSCLTRVLPLQEQVMLWLQAPPAGHL